MSLKQIQIIIRKFEYEKNKLMNSIAKLNFNIQKKELGINRLKSYQQEYNKDSTLALSKSVPSLNTNLDKFSIKIHDLMATEEAEIKRLEESKKILIQKYEELNNQVRIMGEMELKAKAEIAKASDKVEQKRLDDLAVHKSSTETDYE